MAAKKKATMAKKTVAKPVSEKETSPSPPPTTSAASAAAAISTSPQKASNNRKRGAKESLEDDSAIISLDKVATEDNPIILSMLSIGQSMFYSVTDKLTKEERRIQCNLTENLLKLGNTPIGVKTNLVELCARLTYYFFDQISINAFSTIWSEYLRHQPIPLLGAYIASAFTSQKAEMASFVTREYLKTTKDDMHLFADGLWDLVEPVDSVYRTKNCFRDMNPNCENIFTRISQMNVLESDRERAIAGLLVVAYMVLRMGKNEEDAYVFWGALRNHLNIANIQDSIEEAKYWWGGTLPAGIINHACTTSLFGNLSETKATEKEIRARLYEALFSTNTAAE